MTISALFPGLSKRPLSRIGLAAALAPCRVAVLGYGSEARARAIALRSAGFDVTVGVRLGGMSWVRAKEDGFFPLPTATAARGAEIVALHVPAREQASVFASGAAPFVRRDALLVVGGALALAAGAFEPRGVDVVLVAGERREGGRSAARVAVWNDATGRALDRALAHARAAFGEGAWIGTTTIETELDAELRALEGDAGGARVLLEAVERAASRARDSHAPDEAEVAFYEGLLRLVLERRTNELPPVLAVPRRTRGLA